MLVSALIRYQTLSDDPVSSYGKSYTIRDSMGPVHWFPVATDRIVGLGLKVGRDLNLFACCISVDSPKSHKHIN